MAISNRSKTSKRATNTGGLFKFELPNLNLLILIIIFIIGGFLMVFSASAVLANNSYSDPFYYVKRQFIFTIIGLIFGYIIYIIPEKTLRKLCVPLFVSTMIFLAYLVPAGLLHINLPGSVTIGGATRWIGISTIFNIQPSELVKFAMIIFISYWLTLDNKGIEAVNKFILKFRDLKSNKYNKTKGIPTIIYPSLKLIIDYFFPYLIILIIALLILIEKDLSTTVVLVITFLVIMFVNSSDLIRRRILYLFVIILLVAGTLTIVTVNYRQNRLDSYIQILTHGEPSDKQGNSFQIWNGIIGIGSGGFFGLGYTESKQKLYFLQEAAYTDSIFAVFAEEFGLFGSIVMVIGFVSFFSIGFKIAGESKSRFLSLVAVGLTSLVTIQAFFNIGANLSIIPFGGIPLPFISYGGSFTIIILISCGLLLNISKQSNRKDNPIKLERSR